LPPEARLLDLYVDAQGLGSRVGEICKKRMILAKSSLFLPL
jgi:hypothetical protein